MASKKTLVLGAEGQLGRALREIYDGDTSVEFAGRGQFDLSSEESYGSRNWKNYSTIINAAAYTAVDSAETTEGRAAAWDVNVSAVTRLARLAVEYDLTLVHVSSDYVFDGTRKAHDESEPFTPLGVYGQTKAAADAVVGVVPRHYIVRTSWVVGEGANFVRTMASLALKGIKPTVVDDQVGRLSFAQDIAAGIKHLLHSGADFGIYNLTNEGPPQTWAEVAARVYELSGVPRHHVSGVSTAEYFSGKTAARRPLASLLNLTKIANTGFKPASADSRLQEYLAETLRQNDSRS